ncbi:hypothetical protein BCR44DRAFT_1435156 [Catenaria anguillulae PL171]|uniref:Uncharacterized protein n=1 Tax=Catenaria anguillulae PL171 TaxID=765915 RepID=A0A1Y2HKP6_9FUNG|nr:hypothetical protein BCR44DRAFT_1435156 [Catenaria anguillulae PL171]
MSDANASNSTDVVVGGEETVCVLIAIFFVGTNITFHLAALWTCLMYIRNRAPTRAYFMGTAVVATIRCIEVFLGAAAVTHSESSVPMAMTKAFFSAVSHSTLLLIHVRRVQSMAHHSLDQDSTFRRLFLVFVVLVFISVITLLWSVADTILPLTLQTQVTSYTVTLGNIASATLVNLTHVILLLYAMSIQYQETRSPTLLVKPALMWWTGAMFGLACLGNTVAVGLCAIDPLFDPQWGLSNLMIGVQTHAFTTYV